MENAAALRQAIWVESIIRILWNATATLFVAIVSILYYKNNIGIEKYIFFYENLEKSENYTIQNNDTPHSIMVWNLAKCVRLQVSNCKGYYISLPLLLSLATGSAFLYQVKI